MPRRSLLRNLATLSNFANSIVRLDGRFDYLPQTNRHFAARTNEALDVVLT